MIWLSILSNFIYDGIKNAKWLLWERKMTWAACLGVHIDFEQAYKTLKVIERVRLHLLCYKVTK